MFFRGLSSTTIESFFLVGSVRRGRGPLPGNSFVERQKSFLFQAGVPRGGRDSSRTGSDLRADRHPCRCSLPRPSGGLGHARLSPGVALAPGSGGGRTPTDPFSQPAGGFAAAASTAGTGGSPVYRGAGGYESTPVYSASRLSQEPAPSIPGRSPHADAANGLWPCWLIFIQGTVCLPPHRLD